jgi:hypothetical protein
VSPSAGGRVKAAVSWFRELSDWVQGLIVIAGAATGAFFFFFPGCEPEKRCPGTLGVKLSDASIDQSVRRSAYLELIGASPGQASQARLNEIGKLIDVNVHAVGYRNDDLQAVWWLLSSGGEPVDPRTSGQLGTLVTPTACTDNARVKIWAGPIPHTRKSYLVEVRLLDPNGVELARLRTRRFSGLGPA